MKAGTIIETYGSIIKEENLQTLKSNILPNTFVLEETEPFSAYHGTTVPKDPAPFHIYLVTKKKYKGEKILRATRNIRQYFKTPFDGTPAELCIFNDVFQCIRVRNLPSFDLISELQQCYINEGIGLRRRKQYNNMGVIMLRKSMELEVLGEGLYKDLEAEHIQYFEIPQKLSWKAFVSITKTVKNNLENNNFDAAIGVLYRKDIVDLVRIYEKECSLERLEEIRATYDEYIHKYNL